MLDSMKLLSQHTQQINHIKVNSPIKADAGLHDLSNKTIRAFKASREYRGIPCITRCESRGVIAHTVFLRIFRRISRAYLAIIQDGQAKTINACKLTQLK